MLAPSPKGERYEQSKNAIIYGGEGRIGGAAPSLVAKWSAWGPHLQSVLRIVAAFMFMPTGTMKLFAFPAGIPRTAARSS